MVGQSLGFAGGDNRRRGEQKCEGGWDQQFDARSHVFQANRGGAILQRAPQFVSVKLTPSSI